ncbi:MAG: class I poly(R)-hydroxyalkanoic acid synthase [Methylovirgula sp.]
MSTKDKAKKARRREAARKRKAKNARPEATLQRTKDVTLAEIAPPENEACDLAATKKHVESKQNGTSDPVAAQESSLPAASHSNRLESAHASSEQRQTPSAPMKNLDTTSESTSIKSAGGKPDFDLLPQNLARLATQGAKALAAFLEPFEKGQASNQMAEQVADAVRSFGRVAEYWLGDPSRTVQAQKTLSSNFLSLWAHTLRRLSGEAEAPIVPYNPSDKRYAAPQWRDSAIFDFLRQAHAITSDWANDLVARAETTDPEVRAKAQFYLRQITSALSPSNFIVTNPELLRETLASNAENLVRGATFLTEDIAAGHGTLKIRQSDSSQFELGVNMAATPGKVIFRNELIELIQYEPATEQVFKRPLLIIPPWINKFYILDLNPQKSFVRFAVEQGFTVFLVSWVNPDSRHRDMGFDAYIRHGIDAPLDVIETITGEHKIAALGYCVGGTLLAIALALLARRHDARIDSVTFLTTQTDFADAGDLKIFISEPQIGAIEEMMAESGYLDGTKMATVFNMLRPNDLIWSFVVNNYMRGVPPLPFDLLTWNSDSTRMTAANHSFYLRNCYLDNKLAKGEMVIEGEKLDLAEVKVPIYNLAAREDHIAPARSVYAGAKLFGGEMRYVLAGSGHIAGVINPANSHKYQYWTGPRPQGTLEDWLKAAAEHNGSWWPDWAEWLAGQAPEKVPARTPGSDKFPPLCDAPGDYVRVKS